MAGKGPTGKIQTVLGPIEPAQLGITLMHEHMLIDTTCYFRESEYASIRAMRDMPFYPEMTSRPDGLYNHHLDGARMFDEQASTEDVLEFKHVGGSAFVDTTSVGIGRDPLALARISRATGLHAIMGCSYYVTDSHPADMDDRTEDQITEEIITDVIQGVGETGIKSGIIGEVGNFHPLSANEVKVLRASGRAQAETGAAVTIHSGAHDDSPANILDELIEGGADPTRCILGHLDAAIEDFGALKSLAETGCFLEYDIFSWEDTGPFVDGIINMPNDGERLSRIAFLIEQGFEDQIVIAHDICRKWHMRRNGGKGYAHIIDSIVPRMLGMGITQEQVDKILIHNPARALTFS
jgi:phosphotriesterase-related protein